VGIFANHQATTRLVGALLAENNDEWFVSRSCMNMNIASPPSKQLDFAEQCEHQAALEHKAYDGNMASYTRP
jgi:hypothetical protein